MSKALENFVPQKVTKVKPSATLEVARKAGEMLRAGKDVIKLNAGEPDFDTPACVVKHAREMLNEGWTHRYTPARGSRELLDAAKLKFKRDQKIETEDKNLLCTVGSKGSIALAIDALIGEGDECILFAPSWVSYAALVTMAGGVPVMCETRAEDGFVPQPEALKKVLSDKTKLVIINSPQNPSGAVLLKDDLVALYDVLKDTRAFVLSDEVYERLIYDGLEHISGASISDDARQRTLVVSGVAKGYAMTGWRVGVIAGHEKVISAMHLMQGQRVTCPSAIAQAAAAYALSEGPEVKAAVESMRSEYESRRDQLVSDLRSIDGLKVVKPKGSFYAFVDLSYFEKDDIRLANWLLEESHLAAVPGSPFGVPGSLRVSFATSKSVLAQGVERLKTALQRYKGA